MSYSQDELKKYLQKAEEVQKKNGFLSQQDIEQIANKLGFNTLQINEALNDFINRGSNHLKFENHSDAINAYKQALMLDARNITVLKGLTKAYYQMWQANPNNEEIQQQLLMYANQCIVVDVDDEQAYQLISLLKKELKKKLPKKEFPSQKKAKVAPPPQNEIKKEEKKEEDTELHPAFWLFVLLWILLVWGLYKRNSLQDWFNNRGTRHHTTQKTQKTTKTEEPSPTPEAVGATRQLRIAASDQGFVLWRIDDGQQLFITKAATGEVIKERNVPEIYTNNKAPEWWKSYHQVGQRFFDFYTDAAGNKTLQARDVLTGALTNDLRSITIKAFSDSSKVGKIDSLYGQNWVLLESPSGKKVGYNLQSEVVVPAQKLSKMVNARGFVGIAENGKDLLNWENHWLYVKHPNEREEAQQIVLAKLQYKRYNYKMRLTQTELENLVKKGLLKVVDDANRKEYYRTPQIIYSDDDYALIRYKNEAIEGQFRIACLKKDGNTAWRLPENVTFPILKQYRQSQTIDNFPVNFARQGDVLGISSGNVTVNGRNEAAAFGINLKTGAIVWRYVAKQKTKDKE